MAELLNTPENTSYHHPINLNDPENLTLSPTSKLFYYYSN